MKRKAKQVWVKIYESRPYPPFLMVPATKATVLDFAKLFPQSRITCGGNYWHNAKDIYFYLGDEFKKTVDNLVAKSIARPKFLYDLFEVAFKKAKTLNEFSAKYLKSNLSAVASDELVNFIENFSKKFIDMYRYGTVASLMGYSDDNQLYLKANKILQQKTKNCPEKFADYLVILTNPTKRLKNSQQELAILQLAQAAQTKRIKTPKAIKTHFISELKSIYNQFSFLSFDLCNTLGWDINHYAELVADKVNLDIKKLIKNLNNYEKNTQSNFKALIKELSLDDKEIKIFNLIRNLGFYKWAREYEFQQALYRAKSVQDELGKRCGLSELESKYLLPAEFKRALRAPKEFKRILRARLKDFLVLNYQKKGTVIFDKESAKKEFSKIKFVGKEIKAANKMVFKGTPAQSGKATGIVKIVNAHKDLIKMKPGNVLVSVSTGPELLSAMKKAAAIITDEGGITCHAAIVSRELGIPCIVGTKIATKVLKDGDRVEVDANRGMVKIIK